MPSDRRPTTGRSSRRKRPVNAVRQTRPAPQPARRSGLTTRAAVLGLVVCALVVSAALPLREFLSQRSQIAEARAAQAEQRQRVQVLEDQLRQLQDPAYVQGQARTRLHFVLPGETAYVVLTPSAAPLPSGAARIGAAEESDSPWYSQVWGSVAAADRPAPRPTPSR